MLYGALTTLLPLVVKASSVKLLRRTIGAGMARPVSMASRLSVLQLLPTGKTPQPLAVERAVVDQLDSNDVARGAGYIMDACTRSDGLVSGTAPAYGNDKLIVEIRN
jgi:hypothetical protein